MNRKLLLVCLVLGVILCIAVRCNGDTINGVLSEERVVRLPQDQGKWYISVVGDASDARYQEVLGWFSNVESLKTLKDRVHFCQVTTDSPTYKERYSPNVRGLPTVRVQNDKGVVIYEVAGKRIPMTGEGLYAAIAIAVNGSEELLPWRRNHVHPQPEPKPDPKPILPILDPEPQPIDDGGAPEIDLLSDLSLWLVPICVLGLLIGVAIGQWEKLKEKWAGKK
jgi:hypothetical protein